MACGAPNILLGTAQRYAEWFDCQAETIGRDGFLGMAGYSLNSGLLTAVLTIFVALIGYRLLLGNRIDLSDGTSWAVKVGIVLAVVTGWGAFQTVFYDVAVAGPADIARRIAGASGIGLDDNAVRLQRVYDSLRLGLDVPFSGIADANPYRAQPPLELTAALTLLVTIGFAGAAKLAVGFLLAIAPLPTLALLFGPGSGLFAGWLRALLAATLASAGLALSGALVLLAMESEVARMQSLGLASAQLRDEQAPLALALIFIAVSIAIVAASAKAASGIAEQLWTMPRSSAQPSLVQDASNRVFMTDQTLRASQTFVTAQGTSNASRPARIVEAFERDSRRGGSFLNAPLVPTTRRGSQPDNNAQGSPIYRSAGAASGTRQALGRRHRSSIRRDRTA